MQDSINKNPLDDQNDQEIFFDKRTYDKIHKHLTDINDEISDEDIRNVNTEINSDNSSDKENETNEKTETGESISSDANDNKNDDEPNEQMPSTYNVLDS